MKKRRVLIFPGGTSAIHSDRHKKAITVIEVEARRREYECSVVHYPGHDGESSGALNYRSAVDKAHVLCHDFQPNWLIARSFGCVVAVAVLASQEGWLDQCEGAVLWGPYFGAAVERLVPNDEKKRQMIDKYRRERKTFLASDFFQIPPIENLIRKVRCDMRLVRGTRDSSTSSEEMEFLGAVHHRAQPDYLSEVVVIGGLTHEVVEEDLSAELMALYHDSLFAPIVARSKQ